MTNLNYTDRFVNRHVSTNQRDVSEILKTIGVPSIEELLNKTIPSQIRMDKGLKLDEPITEFEFLNHIREIASKNKIYKSYIGLGYNPTITPPPIQRNILENPGWYTQYTPYQAEISQGRLEALLNFQTVVSDLTGMPLANASLLDEATAAAEAMLMLFAARKKDKKSANVFFVSDRVFPHTIDVILTRAVPLGIEVIVGDVNKEELTDDIFGLLVQYPDKNGEICDYSKLFELATQKSIGKVVAADIMSLLLVKEPVKFGADVVVGSTQRFGVPMAFGGPHAGYFATKEEYKRLIPGRIIGISIDANGDRALRMALQTREQHIKREKATSNICTAQVLLAIMAGMYAVYHGPKGLKLIAERINNLTSILNTELQKLGYQQLNKIFFDTVRIKVDEQIKSEINKIALDKKINLNYFNEEEICISVSEVDNFKTIKEVVEIFASVKNQNISELSKETSPTISDMFLRETEYLTAKVFNSYQTETELMRYIKRLEGRDLSLTTSMIPLGSCTMKLNASSELFGITFPEFANVHPFAPKEQVEGYYELFENLGNQLKEITQFQGVSFQPNSGAAGEYAGLMVIRAYHHSKGDTGRNVIIIPASAHGTNPASAVMAGGKVVVVKCDDKGNIDVEDLKSKCEENKENLSALMVTYPSTHGVFEESIIEVCKIVHDNGGQVYMDGANMNAQVGFTSPGTIGADVCHLNLHKTFAIPHGGGGPGVGPICVAEHLKPFLPNHKIIKIDNEAKEYIGAVSASPYGSAGVVLITYAYIKMLGAKGLEKATEMAIVNANYIKAKLEEEYPVLYKGQNGYVAHEMILDMRSFKNTSGIEVEDIAKRLMDYGYHAPTVSFPVAGTLMVEPTESESKAELDKFCEAMLLIKKEIEKIENGIFDKEDNPLKNSPHTVKEVVLKEWKHAYSREEAAFPISYNLGNKFWPYVSRVNNAHGDRNLFCRCADIEEYME